MADIVGDNLAGDVDRLSSAWEGLISQGTALNEIYRESVQALIRLIGLIGDADDITKDYSKGLNDEVNLIWDDYEGFSFTQYNILRDSTGNGNWEQLANVANTSFTYTDLTPPKSSEIARPADFPIVPCGTQIYLNLCQL